MKFAATIFAVSALTTYAIAVPSAEAEAKLKHHHGRLGFCGAPGTPCLGGRDNIPVEGSEIGACGAPGNPCNTVKRAAHAIAEALAEARNVDSDSTFCGVPGQPCEKAKAQIDTIADFTKDAYTKVYQREALAEAEADPEANPRGRLGFCGAPGTPCLGGRSAEPEAEAFPRGRLGFCGAPGTPCLGGRAADPEAEAAARGRLGFCGAPGTPCLGGRDAEPRRHHGRLGFCGAPGTPCLVGRSAEAEAKLKHHHGRLGFCGAPGTPCLGGRSAEAEAEARGRLGFCGAPGTPCLGGRSAEAEAKLKHHHGRLGFCGAPGTPCLGGRDAEAIGKIISNADPTHLKKECFKEGNECHTILKVYQAFQEVKRDAEAAKNETDPMVKLALCGKKDSKCYALTKAHQYATKENEAAAKKAEEECNGPDGACTLAQKDLDVLERNISEAVSALHDEQ